MRVVNGRLEDSRGPVQLKGINWFGFNNGTTMLDGLWGQDPISKDFATVVWRLRLLGFNAVRLPFSFQDLHQLSPRDWSGHWDAVNEADMAKAVTPPSRQPRPGQALPGLASPPSRKQASRCNDYLPSSSSTYDRYCWVVHFFAANGFYVLVDNHLREDQTALQDSRRWAEQWAQLVADLTSNSATAEHLLVDVLNEPDNYGIKWEPGNRGLADLYLQAMDAIHARAPEVLFFLEGTGQSGIGANWGDGFATDPHLVKAKGLSDPTPFFQALLSRPYAQQVVLCPHVYGPGVTHSSQGATGPGLFQRLTQSFGYLTQRGFTGPHGQQVTFPVAIGEFGSKFEDAQDTTAMHDLALYLENVGPGHDGQHRAIPHWFYWCWNANSGDTGGIVGDDWSTIHWNKIEYLITCGLRPWFLDNTVPGSASSPQQPLLNPSNTLPNPQSNATPDPGQAPEVVQQQPMGQQQAWPVPGQSQQGHFQQGHLQQQGQTLKQQPQQSTAPGQQWPESVGGGGAAAAAVQAVVAVGQPWQAGPGKWQCDVNVSVKNTGQSPIPVPWQLSMQCQQYEALAQTWNWQATCSANTVSGTATEQWQSLLPGSEGKVGGVVECARPSVTPDQFVPHTVLLNGFACSVRT